MISQKQKTKPQQHDTVARIAIAEDGRIVYASSTFCELSHIKPNTIKDTPALSLLSFSQQKENLETIESGAHTVKINGQAETLEFHFDWLTLPDKKRYLVGSEITEDKASFETILTNLGNKQSSNNTTTDDLESFLTLSEDIMIVINSAGEIIRTNDKFQNLFDSKKTKEFIDLFAEQDKPHIRQTLQTLGFGEEREEKTVIDFEAQALDKNGKPRWVEWRQYKKNDLIYSTGRDVSAIKQQQIALSRREKQLSQAESIGRMGHWHWTIGQDSVEWSEEIYRIFGVQQKRFNPTLESMNKAVHKQDIGRVNQAFQRAIIEENDYDMEFRIIQPSGDVRFIRCEGRCAQDAEGEVVALYGIMQDMTERILYERKLKEAKDSAERAYAAKSQFLANMSHELRTPLNAIIGFSEMMQRQLLGPIGTEKYLEYVSGIRESGEHLLDLISDILDMSKIEAGKYELDLEEVNIRKCINMAVHMMEGRALEANVKIKINKIPEDLKIIADRRALMQILLNLISNAVKFTKEDGGQITTECHQREDYITLKVIDNGIGIPANKLAQITRPFEQASSSYARDHDGSGLGLAITKELAEMHGGALFIESTIDVGTTVTIRLPYDAFKKIRTENPS